MYQLLSWLIYKLIHLEINYLIDLLHCLFVNLFDCFFSFICFFHVILSITTLKMMRRRYLHVSSHNDDQLLPKIDHQPHSNKCMTSLPDFALMWVSLFSFRHYLHNHHLHNHHLLLASIIVIKFMRLQYSVCFS